MVHVFVLLQDMTDTALAESMDEVTKRRTQERCVCVCVCVCVCMRVRDKERRTRTPLKGWMPILWVVIYICALLVITIAMLPLL